MLTRQEWKGVIDFSQAVDAKIVTSFAISAGTRDASGVWTPNLAQQWVAYTKSVGGNIAAAEFMNEPNIAMEAAAAHPRITAPRTLAAISQSSTRFKSSICLICCSSVPVAREKLLRPR